MNFLRGERRGGDYNPREAPLSTQETGKIKDQI
jgi:hypothetical protein